MVTAVILNNAHQHIDCAQAEMTSNLQSKTLIANWVEEVRSLKHDLNQVLFVE